MVATTPPVVPAPWSLNGEGWIVPQFQQVSAVAPFIPPGCTVVAWCGWTPGGYVCVDYHHSPVGPYREIMFVAGLVRRGLQLGFHISHIAVDSAASVVGGQANWWLPKSLLEFEIERHQHTTRFASHKDGIAIATGLFSDNQWLQLAFTQRWWPLHLLQARAGHLRHSAFWARGHLGLANGLFDVHNVTHLPSLAPIVRLPLVHVQRFELHFEEGRTLHA